MLSRLTFCTVSFALPAFAQLPSDQIEQVGPAGKGTMSQISAGGRNLDVSTPVETRTALEPAQLSSGRQSVPSGTQISPDLPSAQPLRQLYQGGRSAQPPEALSTPSQGRMGTVARVDGDDRCDSALPIERRDPACARVIENRASQFSRPERPTLSPEQRIIAERRLREAPPSIEAAARRLAHDPNDTESEGAQAVAAIVLPAPAPEA
jgi:hypothetical protein